MCERCIMPEEFKCTIYISVGLLYFVSLLYYLRLKLYYFSILSFCPVKLHRKWLDEYPFKSCVLVSAHGKSVTSHLSCRNNRYSLQH